MLPALEFKLLKVVGSAPDKFNKASPTAIKDDGKVLTVCDH